MNSSERNIRILGVALLIGFATTVAAVYWDLPGRLRPAVSDGSPDQKPLRMQPSMTAAGAGRCPVYRGQEGVAATTPDAEAGVGGGCCAKKPAAAKHECGMESAACEHGKATQGSLATPARVAQPKSAANESH